MTLDRRRGGGEAYNNTWLEQVMCCGLAISWNGSHHGLRPTSTRHFARTPYYSQSVHTFHIFHGLETYSPHQRYNVIDAVRQIDGSIVAIKTTRNDTQEIAIASYLSSAHLMTDPMNHFVLLVEVLPDPFNSVRSLMVFPYLRPFDDPGFGAIGEVVDFVKQTLEVRLFLRLSVACSDVPSPGHLLPSPTPNSTQVISCRPTGTCQLIVYRDCAAANIMMDGHPLFPYGHHPVRRGHSPDSVHDLVPLSRIDHPVRYYLIDFGISSRFPPGASSFVVGRQGRDKGLPELSSDVPYNAFKVDIFTLGNLYGKDFAEVSPLIACNQLGLTHNRNITGLNSCSL